MSNHDSVVNNTVAPMGVTVVSRDQSLMSVSMSPAVEPKKADTKKAERTQANIVAAAIELFTEQGYDATTMRQVAERAGVSVGNSYYYFKSKEELVQAFYGDFSHLVTDLMIARVAAIDSLEQRIITAMDVWIETAEPYHPFFHVFLRNATDFDSTNSPFSEASTPSRHSSYVAWKSIMEGASDAPNLAALSPEVAERIPQVLWLYSLAIIAIWSQDPTDQSVRVRSILRRTAGPVSQAMRLATTPIAAGLALQLVGLLDEIAHLRDPIP
jgi:AcrR family transcriptional regulator